MADNQKIIILHGDDEEAISGLIREIRTTACCGPMGDLNFSAVDGKTVTAENFSNAVMAMPFMTEERVVILSNPLAMAGGRDGNQKFLSLLESIPPTTCIYLLIPDEIERKDWVTLGKTNFLRKWADKNKDKALIKEMRLPPVNTMKEWIVRKALAMGGAIENPAAQLMVSAVGNDTRYAANELEKLLLYVNYERPVDSDDVRELVSGSVSVSIFDMVDALVTGNAKNALHTLHRLMDDEEIPILFSMIVRQFRLLIQTREILDEHGSSQDVQSKMAQVPFVADKLCRQATAFSKAKLDTIYHRLLDIDFAFKTSQTEPMAALDTFVLDVAKMIQK